MQAGVPQGSVLSPTLFNMYINGAPQTRDVHLALFADDTCLYATDRKEGFIVRKLQRGLSSMETWCERWNIKIYEDKTRGIYFSRRLPPESHLTLNGRVMHPQQSVMPPELRHWNPSAESGFLTLVVQGVMAAIDQW
jgi:hypothetical protein